MQPPPSTANDTGTVLADEPPAWASATAAYSLRLPSSHTDPGITYMYPTTPWHSS
jgi:hypothetical protein